MNDAVKQAIYNELNTILKEPGQQNEERLKQLKFTECKFLFKFPEFVYVSKCESF